MAWLNGALYPSSNASSVEQTMRIEVTSSSSSSRVLSQGTNVGVFSLTCMSAVHLENGIVSFHCAIITNKHIETAIYELAFTECLYFPAKILLIKSACGPCLKTSRYQLLQRQTMGTESKILPYSITSEVSFN